MRLWELEGGDEDGDNGFAGGRAPQEAQADMNPQDPALIALEEAIMGDVAENAGGRNANVEPERPAPNDNAPQVDVAREGPLVLRIDAGALPARAVPGGHQQAAAPAPRQARGGAQNPRRNPAVARQRQQQGQQGQQGQRGRGGRGRGFGPRQNQNQGQNRGAPHLAQREQNVDEQARDGAGQELHAGEAAWIRQFVQLALNDNEHLLDGDE